MFFFLKCSNSIKPWSHGCYVKRSKLRDTIMEENVWFKSLRTVLEKNVFLFSNHYTWYTSVLWCIWAENSNSFELGEINNELLIPSWIRSWDIRFKWQHKFWTLVPLKLVPGKPRQRWNGKKSFLDHFRIWDWPAHNSLRRTNELISRCV